MKVFFLFCCLLVLNLHHAIGQSSLPVDLVQKLDSISTQDVPEDAPGIATAIIQDGEVIYKKYAGIADFADSSFIQNSSRFNIASNGKQFTALAILSLVDQQQLSLSDDIRKWFPNLYPNIQKKISVQNLLNHTSGIRDCYDLWSLQGYTWWKKSFDNNDVLALIQQQTYLNFEPDTKYLYSNTNYILLALLIEKVSQKPFAAYTQEMFEQLKMPNTAFESDYTDIQGSVARAYFNFDTWSTYTWIWNVVGDGNLFSTLEDQIQWEKLVQGKGSTTFNREIIRQSQQAIHGSAFANYGYGLEFGKYKGMPYSFHEGATGAWKATVIRFPERKVSMITLTNTGKSIPAMQTRQMADVLFDLKTDKEYLITEPSTIGSYVNEEEILGTYLTENDFAFTFFAKDGKVYLKREGRNDVELVREADNIFHQKFDPAFKQEFTTNANGDKLVTAYYINHAPYTLQKVESIAADFDFVKFNGAYINDETNTTISIQHLNDTNYEVTFRNDNKTSGLLVSNTKMLVNAYSLEFQDGYILLNGDRIKNVKFVRE